MDGGRLGRAHRMLRQRQRLTQADASARSGVARWKIVRLEAGRSAELRLQDIERCFSVLDAHLDVRVWHHGAAIDRLFDEGHARLVAQMALLLREHGWEVKVEVSFSEFGERGSFDLLAWHPGKQALLVQEMKTELGSVEGTLRPFDAKCRLAIKVVGERYGWKPLIMGRMLVMPEERTVRRQVGRFAGLLYGQLPARSRALRSWAVAPTGNIAGIWFLTEVQPVDGKRNPSAILRVRRSRPRSDEAA